MSWSEDDPGQGAPDGISALATMIGEVADAAASAQSNLQKLKDQASDAIWRGPAADAFHSRIDKLPGHLQQLAKSYDDARSGFNTYSAAVADIKQKQAVVEKEVSSAKTAHSTATSQQASYVPPDGGTTGTATKNPYDDAVAAAASRLSTATGKLHDLADDRRTADSKVKGSLKDAHNDGMKNKSGWAHFWDKVSTVLAVVAIVLLVVAVIAVCVAFPAAIAAFMAADGIIAGLAAGGAVLGAAGFGGTLGLAMTVTGVLSLLAEGGQYANGEGSLQHLLFDAALTLGPTAIVRGTRYLAQSRAALAELADASDALRRISGVRAIVPEGKLNYMFGLVVSNLHNQERSQQIMTALDRIGIRDGAASRVLLRAHLQQVASTDENIVRTFMTEYGKSEVRESLIAGPYGFLKLVTTWQVEPGGLRFTTVIPKEGG